MEIGHEYLYFNLTEHFYLRNASFILFVRINSTDFSRREHMRVSFLLVEEKNGEKPLKSIVSTAMNCSTGVCLKYKGIIMALHNNTDGESKEERRVKLNTTK